MPSEFQRSTRSLADFHKFKSTEFQFLLLYAGPVIFKKILPETVYKHFLLLHVGCRVLCSNELALPKLEHARYFLNLLVNISHLIYGAQFLVGTIHNLIHLADDVEYMNCCLPEISAYSFESLLGKIKKLIRNGNKPISQLCRRFNEISFSMCPKPQLPETLEILKESNRANNRVFIIKQIKFKGVLLTIKAPDNFVLLNNAEILKINNIYRSSEEDISLINISGHVLKKKKSLYISL